MKLTALQRQAPEPAVALTVGLLQAIGADDFAGLLLRAIGAVLPVSHCTVFALRSSGRVERVSTASAVGEVASLTAVEYMRLGFDQQDSNMVWLARRKPSKALQLWIGHQLANEVANENYRRVCYGETGIRERLSLLAVFPDGYRVTFSLYRNFSYPDYGVEDIDWLSQHSTVIAMAVMRHVELTRRPMAEHPLQDQLMTKLSGRERQLITHVLSGLTTKEAALEMGISATTALTYRYRAFQHLGVSSHRELLVLLGASISRSSRRKRTHTSGL
ncbi:helix-turn-helix transcriptional regulator [Verminephrobacter eiseniae]|uniref:helix-turn-helix transcriptional regulator n=1 Tax=Verminephrobacter eiseniae TaxID=364317 RepID=UPI0010D7EF54|nr:helix-turn-helix transcriptional regulator [Verminephrobacter eiseniae]KAB7591461.1 helix-turn-helix transcriptional regulator [Verminephrobacter sp. Larva24]MCW5230214.1 LuxR family transcriptional regulator [Verminephrobacter eiseniae]MCW5291947.1 LuxR family transcriptional regulator [Verminephrobacter eiseniae]MCW8184900.1 LuxR family transcriptional regulator [Verminephrobacter eiseniae]MCW8223672.1 LuxR family transcriptional regulator [Verminephrobacter eiseniae]